MTQDELLARLDERIKALDQKLDAILIQTTKTNGRLTKAEDDIIKLNNWKSQLKAIYSFLGVIGSILIVLLTIIFK